MDLGMHNNTDYFQTISSVVCEFLFRPILEVHTRRDRRTLISLLSETPYVVGN